MHMKEGIRLRTVKIISKMNKEKEFTLSDSKTYKVIVIKGIFIQGSINRSLKHNRIEL